MLSNRGVELLVDVFIFGGALWTSLATIKGMIGRNAGRILDALAGRPQPELHDEHEVADLAPPLSSKVPA